MRISMERPELAGTDFNYILDIFNKKNHLNIILMFFIHVLLKFLI